MDKQPMIVYVGSYTNRSTAGIYVFHLDEETCVLSRVGVEEGIRQPTFLAAHPTEDKLYAVCEMENQEGKKAGGAALFQVEPQTGQLAFMQRQATKSIGASFIKTDHTGHGLFLAHYGGGGLSAFKLDPKGAIDPSAAFYPHQYASGVHAKRQEAPHPHSVYPDPSNRYVLVPDLGADRIVIYSLDADEAALTLHKQIDAEPGSGPRHLCFHPDKPWVYVANELSSSVTVFSFDANKGDLQHVHTISTLPDSFIGSNTCAEIHVSPSGGHVYVSNRGDDSIAVFAIDQESGRLTAVECVPTGGKTPRNFAISPNGRFLLAANMDSDNIVTFQVDTESGKLKAIATNEEAAEPVCVLFWRN